MKTFVELWIPKHIYDLVIEECNIQWSRLVYTCYSIFVNWFFWAYSRQWWKAWSGVMNGDFNLIEQRIRYHGWHSKDDNDFYVNMMKD